MKLRLALAALAFAFACAGATRAQEPQQPVEDDTPTMTSDDVAPPPSSATSNGVGAVAGGLGSFPGYLEGFYAGLASQGATAADIAAVRTRIDGGGEVALGVRFDVTSDGRVVNQTVDVRTGLSSIDASFARSIAKDPGQLELLAGFKGVRISVGFSAHTMRVRASGMAPTVGRATELESVWSQARASATADGKDVRLVRNGPSLSLEVTVPIDAR